MSCGETMAERDKRERKEQGKQGNPSGLPDVEGLLENAELSFLQQLKLSRTELEAGVNRALSLSHDERIHLAGAARLASLSIATHSAFHASLLRGVEKDANGTEWRQRALNDLGTALAIDPSGVWPDKKQLFEAEVQRVWSTAKSALNEFLETPEARKLLKSQPARKP